MTTVMKLNPLITVKFKIIDKNEFAGDALIVTPMDINRLPWVLIKSIQVNNDVDFKYVMDKIVSFIHDDFPDRGVFIACRLSEIKKYENAGFTCWKEIKNPIEALPITKKIMIHNSSLRKAWEEEMHLGINDLNKVFDLINY